MLARDFGTALSAEDLQGLGPYEVVAQVFAQLLSEDLLRALETTKGPRSHPAPGVEQGRGANKDLSVERTLLDANSVLIEVTPLRLGSVRTTRLPTTRQVILEIFHILAPHPDTDQPIENPRLPDRRSRLAVIQGELDRTTATLDRLTLIQYRLTIESMSEGPPDREVTAEEIVHLIRAWGFREIKASHIRLQLRRMSGIQGKGAVYYDLERVGRARYRRRT